MRMSRALAVEIVAVTVILLALKGGILGWTLAVAVLVAALVLGVPVHGMTTLDRLGRRRRFRARAASRRRGSDLPATLVPLGRWVPDLAVRQTHSARGDDVGVLTDGESWTALLGLVSDEVLLSDVAREIDLAALRGLTVQDDITFATLQVIDLVIPAPSRVMLPTGSPALESYTQILGTPTLPAAVRRTWIGVRLDPRLCLEAIGVRGAGDEGIYATLRFGLHRVQSALKRQGIVTRELTAHQINDVLAMTAGTTGDGQGSSEEHWDHWSCEGFEHAGSTVDGWGPRPQEAREQLLAELGGLPVVMGISSYTLDSRDRARGAVRVMAARPTDAVAALRELGERCPQIDFAAAGGDQVPVLLGTLPMAREVAA